MNSRADATTPSATDIPGSPRQPRRRSRIGTWCDHHLYSGVASLGRMVRKPWATALTIGVMAIALALPLGLWLVLDNLARLSDNVQQSREISVFLEYDIETERASALAETLRTDPTIARVVLRTPEQGLAELRARSGVGDAITVVGDNPLPSVLIVTPRDDETALVAALKQLPEAETVQYDNVWRQRLDRWLRFGHRVTWVLAAVFGLGALLVVGNTVRLDIQSRREELGVLQLLGATDGFIRRPFLYLGAWYGITAGLASLGLLTLAALALRAPLATLAESYGSDFALHGFDPLRAMIVVVGTAILGWLGAGAVTGHYLRQTRPTTL